MAHAEHLQRLNGVLGLAVAKVADHLATQLRAAGQQAGLLQRLVRTAHCQAQANPPKHRMQTQPWVPAGSGSGPATSGPHRFALRLTVGSVGDGAAGRKLVVHGELLLQFVDLAGGGKEGRAAGLESTSEGRSNGSLFCTANELEVRRHSRGVFR